jgi:serine acetyltransferase
VNRDVQPGQVVVGVPARPIRSAKAPPPAAQADAEPDPGQAGTAPAES